MPYNNYAGLANVMLGVSRLQQNKAALLAQQQQQAVTNEISTAKEFFRLSKDANQGDDDALSQYNQGLKSLYNARKLGGRKDMGEFTPITLQQFRPGRKIRNSAASRAFNLINQTDMSSGKGLQELEGKLYNLGAELNRDLTEKGLPVPQTGIFSPKQQTTRLDFLKKLAGADKFMLGKAGEQVISTETGLPVGKQIPFEPKAEINIKALERVKRQLAEEYSTGKISLDDFTGKIKQLEATTPQVQAAAFGPETEKLKVAGQREVDAKELEQIRATTQEKVANIKRKLKLQTRRLSLDYEKALLAKGWDDDKIDTAVKEYNKQLQTDIIDNPTANLNQFWRK